jgi:hypothetical protein
MIDWFMNLYKKSLATMLVHTLENINIANQWEFADDEAMLCYIEATRTFDDESTEESI